MLMRDVADVVLDFPQARLTGPAVIDFEWHQLAAALDSLPPDLNLSALSHHLYVDRRGAPENRQGRHDLVGKLAVLRAFAGLHPRCAERVVVSETNWPLLGTGVWSAVGSPYVSPGERRNDPSVSEDDYAAYLIRYYLLALASGLADRVYWWKLSAHGFGLLDPAVRPWRRRPAFDALATLLRSTAGRTFVRRESDDTGRISLVFASDADARELHVTWRNGPAADTPLPFAVEQAEDMMGRPLPVASSFAVGPAPLYLIRADAS